MTEQTQPTDAEIVELLGDPRYGTIEAVRAAIAKWGTPAGAGGLRDAVIEYRTASNALLLAQMETLGGRAVPIEPSWVEPFDAALRAQAKMYAALDATTPQPTQAQAGFKSGAKSFQTYAEANAYSKGYYAGKKAATKAQAGAAPMSQPNRLTAYSAAEKLRELGYYWDEKAESWVRGIKGGQHGAE